MKETPAINYALALKNYQQNGRGRSMKQFCEEEGYDYNKFMRYSRRGRTELGILKDADGQQARESRFVPLVIDGRPETGPASSRSASASRTVWNSSRGKATSTSCSGWSGRCRHDDMAVTMAMSIKNSFPGSL